MIGSLLDRALEYDVPDTLGNGEPADERASISIPHGSTTLAELVYEAASPESFIEERADLRALLIVLTEAGQPITYLPLQFRNRVRTSLNVLIAGADAADYLSVSVVSDLEARSSRLQLEFTSPYKAQSPKLLLPAIQFWEQLTPGRSLGVWLTNQQFWLLEPIQVPHSRPDLSASFRLLVRALVRFQAFTGTTFPIPRQLSDDELKSIRRVDQLVTGNPLRGRWEKATVMTNFDGLKLMTESSGVFGAQYELLGDEYVEIASRRVHLGAVKYTFFHALIAPGVSPRQEGPDQFAVTLVPGRDPSFEVVLLSKDETGGLQPAKPTAELLRTFAGRWIAQDSNAILFDGDTPESVVEELRRRNRFASVWRVPLSDLEAESVDAIA